jgi:hypothetical protein
MGKSLQKALLVSLVAFAGGVQGAMAEAKARTAEQRNAAVCADLLFAVGSEAAKTPSSTRAPSSREAIAEIGIFSRSCENLLAGGFFTVEAVYRALGIQPPSSFTSAPAAKTSPLNSAPPPRQSTNRRGATYKTE